MINCMNTFLISFTGPQTFIILIIAIILIVGVVFYRQNYTNQIGVAVYMDEECGVYNKDGLVRYLKSHKKKFDAPLLLAVDISNLSTLYNSNISDKRQLMVDVTDCLLEGLTPIETLGRCTSSIFIMALNGKTKEDAKKLTQVIEERLLGLRIPAYGSYNFLLRYGINDVIDMKEIETSVQKTISLFDFSNNRDGNIYYYADTVTSAIAKYNEINAAKDLALESHQFQAYVQPKVSLKTGKVVGGEVLCRWLNSQGEVLYYPNEFIPIFESNGFIKKVDAEMFEQTCQLVQNLSMRGYNDIVISVNFSKVNFESKTFFDEIMDIISKYNCRPQNIEIEITETAIAMSPTYINQCIMKLRNLGFHLSMDDFGKEYSSLGSLVNSPFDTIKMDRVFFMNNLSIEKERVIAQNTLQMLKALNLNVVCEGVENERTLEHIALINNDVIIQGFVHSKPVNVGQFESILQTVYPHDYKTAEPVVAVQAAEQPVQKKGISNEDIDDLETIKMELLRMKKEIEVEKAKKAEDEKKERLRKLKEELESLRSEEKEEEDPYEAQMRELQEEIQAMKNARTSAFGKVEEENTPDAEPAPEEEAEEIALDESAPEEITDLEEEAELEEIEALEEEIASEEPANDEAEGNLESEEPQSEEDEPASMPKSEEEAPAEEPQEPKQESLADKKKRLAALKQKILEKNKAE